MRWLIVGPYAPERSRGAIAATAVAAERLAAGDEVRVISPRPSAAHEHRPLVGERALLSLYTELRPQDGFWIRVEPGVGLTVGASRLRAVTERVALARLLRRAKRSVVDVGDVSLFPGGRAGAIVFRAADELVVHGEPERAALLAAGCDPAKVVLRLLEPPPPVSASREEAAPPTPRREVPPADFSSLATATTKAEIEAAVRARAAQVSQER